MNGQTKLANLHEIIAHVTAAETTFALSTGQDLIELLDADADDAFHEAYRMALEPGGAFYQQTVVPQ